MNRLLTVYELYCEVLIMENIKNVNTAMLEYRRNTLDDEIVEIEHMLTLTQSKLITLHNKNLIEKKRAEMDLIDKELASRKANV